MELVQKEEFTLKGLKLGRKTSNKGGQSSKDCGRLWEIFEAEFYFNKIPHKLNNQIFAVYYAYDDTDQFEYFIGCIVDPHSEETDSLDKLKIPSGQYHHYKVTGKLPDSIAGFWKEIINQKNVNRAYKFDYEVYGAESMDWENAAIEVFISVNV